MAVADAGIARRREVTLEVGAVLGDQVPRRSIHSPPTSSPPCLAAIRSNHESTPRGSSPTASSGPTHAQAGWPSQRPTHGPNSSGDRKARRRHPAPIGHQHRSPRQPVAIVDHHVRVTLALHFNQMRTNQAAPPLRARSHS